MGFDHIKVPNQQNRLVFPRPAQPHHQILLPVIRTQELHVGLAKSRIAKTLRHRLRSRRHAAHRVGGIDLNQLFEDVV